MTDVQVAGIPAIVDASLQEVRAGGVSVVVDASLQEVRAGGVSVVVDASLQTIWAGGILVIVDAIPALGLSIFQRLRGGKGLVDGSLYPYGSEAT